MRTWRRALLTVLLAACVDGPGGPGRFGEVRLEPGYPPGFEPGAIGVALDTAAVSVARVSGELLVDTVLPYAGGALAWIVDLEAEEESLSVSVELRGGGVPLYSGDSVVVVPSGRVGGESATLAVDYVGPALIATVTVSPPSNVLTAAGATVQLTATARDAGGAVIGGVAFDWTSADPVVATVDPLSGLVQAVGSGQTTITATTAGKSGTATVDVSLENPVAFVMVTPATTTLTGIGTTQSFSAVGLDAGGSPVPGVVFTWSSSDSLVATIDPVGGTAMAAGHGSTVITATTGTTSGTATLDVNLAPSVVTVSVTPPSATIGVIGGTQQFTAVASDEHGTPLPGVPVSWSSLDPQVATIDPGNGGAVATGHGSTVITASVGAATGTASLVVDLVPAIASVAVTPASVAFSAIGATQQFTAVVQDGNGNPLPGVPLTWASTAPASVSIDPVSGLATAVANGSATISATAGHASGIAAAVVNQVTITVTVRPDSATLFGFTRVVEFVAEARDANGALLRGAVFSWASSDTTVAIVEPSGRTVPRGLGTATITATTAGVRGSAVLTVLPPPPGTAAPETRGDDRRVGR